jgi:hypothetical protein
MVVKFCLKFSGTAKLNLKRKASDSETAQINRSILKMIHDGVVDLKNLTDLTISWYKRFFNIFWDVFN